MVVTVMTARMLGPEGRGLFSVAMAVANIGVQFGNFGLHASNSYYVARDRSIAGPLTANSLFVGFVVGSAVSVVFWLFITHFSSLIQISGALLILAAVWIPFGLTYLFLQHILIGTQEIRSFNIVEVVSKVFLLVVLAALFLIKRVTVEMVFAACLLPVVLGAAWCLVLLERRFKLQLRTRFSLLRSHVRYGLKSYLSALFAFLVVRIDLLMVQFFKGMEEAGYYSITVALADLLYMFPMVVGMILFPRLSSLKNEHQQWEKSRKITWMLFLGMLPVVFLALYLSDWLIPLFFGSEFLLSVRPFYFLGLGMLFYGPTSVVSSHLSSIGLPRFCVWIYFFICVLNIVLNLFFIPASGAQGAAVASLICYFLMFVFLYVYAEFKYRQLTPAAANA